MIDAATFSERTSAAKREIEMAMVVRGHEEWTPAHSAAMLLRSHMADCSIETFCHEVLKLKVYRVEFIGALGQVEQSFDVPQHEGTSNLLASVTGVLDNSPTVPHSAVFLGERAAVLELIINVGDDQRWHCRYLFGDVQDDFPRAYHRVELTAPAIGTAH